MRVTETRRRACALNYFFFMQQPVAEEWYTRYRDALGSKASRHWKLNVCNWENPASRAPSPTAHHGLEQSDAQDQVHHTGTSRRSDPLGCAMPCACTVTTCATAAPCSSRQAVARARASSIPARTGACRDSPAVVRSASPVECRAWYLWPRLFVSCGLGRRYPDVVVLHSMPPNSRWSGP